MYTTDKFPIDKFWFWLALLSSSARNQHAFKVFNASTPFWRSQVSTCCLFNSLHSNIDSDFLLRVMSLRSALLKVSCEKRNPLRSSNFLNWVLAKQTYRLINIVDIKLLHATGNPVLRCLLGLFGSFYHRNILNNDYLVCFGCNSLGAFVLNSFLWSWSSDKLKALILIVHPVVIIFATSWILGQTSTSAFLVIPRVTSHVIAKVRRVTWPFYGSVCGNDVIWSDREETGLFKDINVSFSG